MSAEELSILHKLDKKIEHLTNIIEMSMEPRLRIVEDKIKETVTKTEFQKETFERGTDFNQHQRDAMNHRVARTKQVTFVVSIILGLSGWAMLVLTMIRMFGGQ